MNIDKRTTGTGSESGNALFLILIAVALFAALSYAVSQSGRGSGTIDRESAIIGAGQVTQYPAMVRATVTRMVITGTAATNIDFTSGAGSTKVFDPTLGGGAPVLSPPNSICGTTAPCSSACPPNGACAAALTNNQWGFASITDATKGFYIKGVGTDTTGSGRDAIAYLHDLSNTVCQQIQRGLGLSTTLSNQGTAVDWTTGTGLGSAAAPTMTAGTGDAFTIAPSAGALSAAGQAFSCWRNGATLFDYFHAIIEK